MKTKILAYLAKIKPDKLKDLGEMRVYIAKLDQECCFLHHPKNIKYDIPRLVFPKPDSFVNCYSGLYFGNHLTLICSLTTVTHSDLLGFVFGDSNLYNIRRYHWDGKLIGFYLMWHKIPSQHPEDGRIIIDDHYYMEFYSGINEGTGHVTGERLQQIEHDMFEKRWRFKTRYDKSI